MAAAGPSSSPSDLSDANVVSMDAKDRFAFMLLERIDRLTDELHALTARVSTLDALPENLTAVPGWLENQISFFVVTSTIGISTETEQQDFARRLSQVILDDDDGFVVVNIKPIAFSKTRSFRCQCFVPTRKRFGAYLVPWLARVSTRLAHLQCSVRVERSLEFGCILNKGGPEWTFRRGESEEARAS
jgi:hypothetical protein